jgi:hypothetical protein
MKRSPLTRKTPLKRAKKPLKRKAKTPRRKLVDRCDAAWSLLVKWRAGWKCEVCGKLTSLQAHHVRPRTRMRLRFEPRNGCCLCWPCHRNFAHGDGPGFASWFKTHRWEDYAFVIKPESIAPIKRADSELREIAESLEWQVAEFERGDFKSAA